jgi:ABC-type transport system substrate-binding protein
VTRRVFLGAGGAALGGMALSSCSLFSLDPSESQKPGSASGRGGAGGKESPALADRVADGRLPSLGERLPENPLVVEPVDQLGSYGGEWHSALLGPEDDAWMYRTIGYEQLLSWDPGFTRPVPNIAESVEADADGRAFTFTLRRGMRWSDGEPFTVKDIAFAYDDILRRDDVTEAVPPFLMSGDRPARLEQVDELTFRFIFDEPQGLFLENLASANAYQLNVWPRHYLERFHRTYNKDADQLARREKLESWQDLIVGKGDQWRNPELPTLRAWTLTNGLGDGSRVVAERNAYYWKTDPKGRQLPYLDRVVYDLVEDAEVILLKASNGELDLHTRHINTLANKPVLARGRAKGGYRFLDLTPGSMNYLIIALNLAHKDRNLRAVFQNKDFRIGLSHAINRDELIRAVFQRQGEPWQACPRKESAFYDEEMAKQYTEYDVERAEQHLDRAGYDARDESGFRLRPDGERITFAVELAVGYDPTWTGAMELVREHWRAVGIDVQIKAEDRNLFIERKEANDHDAAIWSGNQGALDDALVAPLWYFPSSIVDQAYGIPWANWYNGDPGPSEEPPAAVVRQMKLYDRLKVSMDVDERKDLLRQILRIAKEEFYTIGTALPASEYGIVNVDFTNVLDKMPNLWVYPTPGPSRPEQYSIAQ